MSLNYTLLNTWEICPHQAARRYIIKDLPFDQTSEMQVSIAIHEAIAAFLGKGVELPTDYRLYTSLLQPLTLHRIEPERKLAITGQCEPISFFDKDAWLRRVIDAHIIKDDTAVVFDWKTGKECEDPFELEIGALLLKCHHPELKTVKGHYVWLRDQKLGEEDDLSDFAGAWGKVMKFHDEIERGDFEKKTPGPLCKWCPVLDCDHNSEKPLDKVSKVFPKNYRPGSHPSLLIHAPARGATPD